MVYAGNSPMIVKAKSNHKPILKTFATETLMPSSKPGGKISSLLPECRSVISFDTSTKTMNWQ